MARLPAGLLRRATALRVIAVLGVIHLVTGAAGAAIAVMRAELIPAGPAVAPEAISSTGLALGAGVALIGAMHLAAVMAPPSRSVSAATAAVAATLGAALLVGALSALVSDALALFVLLLAAALVYAWLAVVVGTPGPGSAS